MTTPVTNSTPAAGATPPAGPGSQEAPGTVLRQPDGSMLSPQTMTAQMLQGAPNPLAPGSTGTAGAGATAAGGLSVDVKAGDTLSAIAKAHGMTWQQLYDHPENKNAIGSDPNLIKVGQKIVIPGAPAAAGQTTPPSGAAATAATGAGATMPTAATGSYRDKMNQFMSLAMIDNMRQQADAYLMQTTASLAYADPSTQAALQPQIDQTNAQKAQLDASSQQLHTALGAVY